jgi:tetratricopeptide (TPR) repeat protein
LNRVAHLLIAAWLACAAAGFAQDLRVEYLDGLLEVQSGGSWREARLGEMVAGNASVRLSAGALVELAAGELRVTLHQPGTYAVGALLRAGRQSLAWGLGRLVKARLRVLFSAPTGGSQPGGVRAWEVQDPLAELGMMEDEEEEARQAAEQAQQAAVEEIRSLLAGGRAGEAAAAAGRALERAGAAERPYFLFLLASARCLGGGNAAALQALESVQAPEEAPWFPEYALLKGRLLLEGQAWREAQDLFDRLLTGSPEPGMAQPAWFLSAFCSLQLGDRIQARRRLERARDLDAGSEIGVQAKEMLGSL